MPNDCRRARCYAEVLMPTTHHAFARGDSDFSASVAPSNDGSSAATHQARRFGRVAILGRAAFQLPATALLFLIGVYQRTLSPALPMFFGSACGCRFSPTCSHYAAGAIRTHGAVIGTLLAGVRLVKCTPLHPGGIDPVPPKRVSLRCERFAS
jgi:uncharacterized protein